LFVKFTLLSKNRFEARNELDIGSRCNIIVPFKLELVLQAPLFGIFVQPLTQCVIGLFVLELYIIKELFSNGDEAILGPVLVPVDCSTVYQRREHPNTCAEHLTDRAETQDYPEVDFDTLDEEGVYLLNANKLLVSFLSVLSNGFNQLYLFLMLEDIWDFTTIEQIV
jgi:hypothetical protein